LPEQIQEQILILTQKYIKEIKGNRRDFEKALLPIICFFGLYIYVLKNFSEFFGKTFFLLFTFCAEIVNSLADEKT
jgi:hypothetical protein